MLGIILPSVWARRLEAGARGRVRSRSLRWAFSAEDQFEASSIDARDELLFRLPQIQLTRIHVP